MNNEQTNQRERRALKGTITEMKKSLGNSTDLSWQKKKSGKLKINQKGLRNLKRRMKKMSRVSETVETLLGTPMYAQWACWKGGGGKNT